MSDKRPWIRAVLLGVTTAAVAGAAVIAAVGSADAATVSHQYFVDCAAGSDSNTGTEAGHAWKTLAKVASVTLGPGDVVGLRAGTTCTGTLAPKGSGTVDNPVIIKTYSDGALARIDGKGARAAVFLHNVQGYTIKNLEVTNTGATPGATEQRTGIYVLLEDFGTGSGYLVNNVNVHDVNGCDCRFPNASGGIIFEAGGSTKPTGFACVTIKNSVVRHVDRSGIAIFSVWQKRAGNPNGPGASFVPMTDVNINTNTLSDLGGDGIGLVNGDNARVHDNVIDGYNVRTGDYNLGLYAYNSDDTIFKNNQVLNGAGVGIAYGIEDANFGTLFEDNYSRNNAGGFMYICNADGSGGSGNTVRYNISVGDGAPNPFLGLLTLPCAGAQQNMQVYNNSFYAPSSPALIQNFGAAAVKWTNNIFYGQAAGSTINDNLGTYDHNVFYRVSTLPANQTASILADPHFVAANVTAAAADLKLRAGSPAVGAGATVAYAGGQDYFGSPLSSPLNIGAYQGAGL